MIMDSSNPASLALPAGTISSSAERKSSSSISAFEKKNAAYFGRGVVFNKFTGARGKSGSNDANAEYIAKLRKIMDDNKVAFQTAELGKAFDRLS